MLEIIGQDGEFISFQTSYRWSDGRPRPSNDPHVTLTTSSTLRFPSREHVEDLIARSGLVIRTCSETGMLARSMRRAREKSFLSQVIPRPNDQKPGWQAVQGRFADVQPGSKAFAFPNRSLMLSRLTSTTLMLDIETHGCRTDHCRNRAARAHLRCAGQETAEPE